MRAGTRRSPTADELADEQTMFRANAVLALGSSTSDTLTRNEEIVAARVDGFRPVARVKLKTGLASDEFRHALRALVRRKMLVLVALIEEMRAELVGLRDATGESGEGDPDVGHTMPRAPDDHIPPHVMAEIQAMLDDDAKNDAVADSFEEEETDVTTVPQTSEDDNDGPVR